ncbi:MAG: type I DNA topoisomerase, partial [Cyanobacteria bacterium P01_F01_bin.42]
IAPSLSAGRVQSVAVRLLVQKERERLAFVQGSYWDLKAKLEKDNSSFDAKLVTLQDKRLATGSDFDENTGQIIAGRDVVLLSETEAIALKERLATQPWTVAKVEERPVTKRPAPPFTTSTLQQEANRKLRLSARETMRIAQGLYEKGFITYMRTDSVHLSKQAIAAARSCVETLYGQEYLSAKARQYNTKSKGAQEAHEAIRPAGQSFRTPKETGLKAKELSVYELIWKRTVATQMAEAKQTNISVQIKVDDAGFRSSGKRIDFPGFFRAYVEGSDDPDAAIDGQEVLLPRLKEGESTDCKDLQAVGHETQPPARYTEASLVKTLEKEGIGRPSTYATVIGTIIDRGYAQLNGNALQPSFTAFAVTDLLENHFPELVDVGFTARMEQTLDDISTGEAEWLPYLKHFYCGNAGLDNQVKERQDKIDSSEARTIKLNNIAAKVRIGKFGPYVEAEHGEESVTASLPKDMTPADLTTEQIDVIIKQKVDGPDSLGVHPETQEPIYLLVGSYGPYVQLGEVTEENKRPKRTSLPKTIDQKDVTLEIALGLLALPKKLGEHPDSGKPVKVGLGRFGPYIVHDQGKEGKDYRSLKKEDSLFDITFERAMELLSMPKRGRGGRSKEPLRVLGKHPADDEPINIFEGPYGHYVKHNKTNAGLPEGQTVETMTLELAIELIDSKAATKKTKKKATTKKKTTKKSTAKKTTAKKATAKKATTAKKTTAAKKSTTAKSTTRKTAAKKATAAKTSARKAVAKSSKAAAKSITSTDATEKESA